MTTTVVNSADWPAFRGPNGDGISQAAQLLKVWDAQTNIKWKAKLPEVGNGSPIVSNGRLFVACAKNKGQKRGLYCFDRFTGEQLWVQEVKYSKVMPTHKTNNYCGGTPVANGERVVVWHGSAGLYCYDFTGRELWKRDLGEFRHVWGYGSSPVLYDGKVILHAGPGKEVFMIALDLKSGKTVWRTDEPISGDGERNENDKYMGSWSTPVIAKVNDKKLIVCSMSTRVNAYAPESGKIVWSCSGLRGKKGDLAYTSPVIADDICVAMGGFNGPAIGFKMAGQGDITDSRLWRVTRKIPQRIGSGVYLDGYVYMANASGSLIQCIEPKTGVVRWSERTKSASFWGSLVYADGHCYVTDQRGTTVVFQPNPDKCDVVSLNPLEEQSNSTPAISDGQIFIRTFKHLYCIEKAGE